jgi:signal peptidase II
MSMSSANTGPPAATAPNSSLQRWERAAARDGRDGVALFVAGGVSNLLDGIAYGKVIDFMNVGLGPVRTGIFNVADVAIMLAATLVVFAGSSRPRP